MAFIGFVHSLWRALDGKDYGEEVFVSVCDVRHSILNTVLQYCAVVWLTFDFCSFMTHHAGEHSQQCCVFARQPI